MELILRSNNVLRAMACGQSYDFNIKHQFYFDLASKGYSDFKFLSIYKWKSVRYIGLVENIIEADWDEKHGLRVKKSKKKTVTKEQEQRLINAIKDSINEGCSVGKDHNFFLLTEFTKTDFKKTSSGGIFRVRYFNLENELGNIPDSMTEMAEQLKTKTWK